MTEPRSTAQSFYTTSGLGRNYWSDRLARRVKPESIDGNMSVRANLWRALVDWGWGIELQVPYWRRALWIYRRLSPDWMPKFYPKESM